MGPHAVAFGVESFLDPVPSVVTGVRPVRGGTLTPGGGLAKRARGDRGTGFGRVVGGDPVPESGAVIAKLRVVVALISGPVPLVGWHQGAAMP